MHIWGIDWFLFFIYWRMHKKLLTVFIFVKSNSPEYLRFMKSKDMLLSVTKDNDNVISEALIHLASSDVFFLLCPSILIY